MIRTPAVTITTATRMATTESIATTPVASTSTSPASTPSEVSESVPRWAASPASAGEECLRAWWRRK